MQKLANIYFLLFIILVAAFAVRLYKIDNPIADWHSWRQADTASVTRLYIKDGIDLLHPRYHDVSYLQSGKFNPEGWRFVEFPIFNVIHASLVQTFPVFSLEKWGRLLSVFSSLISIVFLFLIGKRFLGKFGGLLSAFFFAFLPFNIYFSRVILPEPMAVAFALASLWFFVRWFDESKLIYVAGSAILFSIAMLVKPYIIFYGIPLFWLAGQKFDWNLTKMSRSKSLWVFFIVAFAPVFTWRVWIRSFPEGIPFYKWVFDNDGIRFRPSFWRWIFGERIGRLILGGWGLVPFVSGLLAPSGKHEQGFVWVFAGGMLAYVSIIASANVRHDYYQTLIIPAIALVLARGVACLWNSNFLLQPATKIATISLMIFTLAFPAYEARELYKINHPEIIRAGEALDKIAPPGAKVVAPYNGDTAFLYQTKRVGWPYQTNSIEELVTLGAGYYISVNLNDPQTQDVMRKYEIPVQNDEFVIVDLSKKRMPKN